MVDCCVITADCQTIESQRLVKKYHHNRMTSSAQGMVEVDVDIGDDSIDDDDDIDVDGDDDVTVTSLSEELAHSW